LQEAREADLILHLIDASDSNRWQRVRQVNAVLKQLEADKVPQIRVYNKIDKLDRTARVTNNRAGEGRSAWLSAETGEGIPLLLDAIGGRLRRKTVHGVIRLHAGQGRQRAKLFDIGAVLSEEACENGGWNIELKMAEKDLRRFLKNENLTEDLLEPLPMAATAVSSK
jgi:GTP-binding protein HflX